MVKPLSLLPIVLASVYLGACHTHAKVKRALQEPPALRYRVSVDTRLQHVEVRVCFPHEPPARLVPGSQDAGKQLTQAVALVEGRQLPLSFDETGIDLAGLPRGGCMIYDVDLPITRLAGVSNSHIQISDLGVWLWQPAQRFSKVMGDADLTLKLPPGVSASVPFARRSGGGYRIDSKTLRYRSRIAFGRFREANFERAGCTAHVALLPGLNEALEAALLSHLQDAVEATASVLGTFPAERLQVIAVPTASHDDAPVRFGHTTRGGGAGVLLLVKDEADPQALARDWTAIHEFSHLLLPFISREDAWLSEGMATYYQEVLRARWGLIGVREALDRLVQGAARLRQCTLPLLTKSHEMARTHDYQVVYWGGATYALLADLELRRRSGGHTTLDSVLRALHTKIHFQAPPVRAKDLLEEMDAIAGMRVFSELAADLVYGKVEADMQSRLDTLIDTPAAFSADFERIVATQRMVLPDARAQEDLAPTVAHGQ